MELMQVMRRRRSIRAYQKDRKVSREAIKLMIEAATLAPTWKNSQTGRYYVVMSDAKVKEVRESCLPVFNQNSTKDAPVYIVTTFVKTRSGFTREGVAENEIGEGWGCYDLGLQNQNLLLKAEELGLGTLVMGIRDSEKLRKILQIPEAEEVVSVIAVGYKDVFPKMPKRKAVEDITKFF